MKKSCGKSSGGSIDALRSKNKGKASVLAAAKERKSGGRVAAGTCNTVGATVSSPISSASKLSSRGK